VRSPASRSISTARIGTTNGELGLHAGGIKQLLQPGFVEGTIGEQFAAAQRVVHPTGDLQYRPTGSPQLIERNAVAANPAERR
jgi:hypothetical protein